MTAASSTMTPDPKGLAVIVETEKGTYQPGEPISLTVSLKNISSHDLVVNRRMAMHMSYAPGKLWDLAFVVSDVSGEGIPSFSRINLPPMKPKDYVLLAPDALFTVQVNQLGNFYSFMTGKQYSIQVIYKNELDPDDNSNAWQGEIKSDPISITIQ